MGLTFVLADGTTIERDVSECHVALVLHPFNRTLPPARMLLA